MKTNGTKHPVENVYRSSQVVKERTRIICGSAVLAADRRVAQEDTDPLLFLLPLLMRGVGLTPPLVAALFGRLVGVTITIFGGSSLNRA